MISKVDETRWRESWHQKLSLHAKMLYTFIWDNADFAGGWEVDIEMAAREIDNSLEKCHIQELIDAGVARYIYVDDKEYLWLIRYMKQFATLSDNFEGHRKVIRMIRYYDLFGEVVVKSLFRDGYQYSVDKDRAKRKLDERNKVQGGERDIFNKLADNGITMTWRNWRRLCQLCPKMDKKQVVSLLLELVPVYLKNHIKVKGKRSKASRLLQPEHLWQLAVDIAEYSEKGIEYTSAMAESLQAKWKSERRDAWQKNKKTREPPAL